MPAVRLVPRFARSAAELAPVRAGAENTAGEAALRVASAALLTSQDVITRAIAHGPGAGVGLRGGTFSAAAAGECFHITLEEIRWTEDVAVSGVIDCSGRSGPVRGTLRVKGPPGASGALEVEWTEGGAQPRATVTGKLGAESVVADAPAP